MQKIRVFKDGDYKELMLADTKMDFGDKMVAFLDIIGFKRKLEKIDIESITEKYRNLLMLISSVNQELAKRGNDLCKYYIFSDSIILISNGDKDENILDFIIAVWKFTQMSMAMGLAFRGGISYGKVYTNEEENVFLGNPIVNAVKLEGVQEWIGVSCDEEAKKRINQIEKFNSENNIVLEALICDYTVPLKKGCSINSKVINWRFNLVVEKGIASLFEKNLEDESVKQKIKNTLIFSKYIRKVGKLYIANSVESRIRSQYPVLFLGESRPPFKNGDEY